MEIDHKLACLNCQKLYFMYAKLEIKRSSQSTDKKVTKSMKIGSLKNTPIFPFYSDLLFQTQFYTENFPNMNLGHPNGQKNDNCYNCLFGTKTLTLFLNR